MNYYNEIDYYAARWLGNLMLAGHVPMGVIDTRSIEDVTPNDLKGFMQCHFFAGIGVWPYALRLAGWPADRPVWTASCPCQPFSAAGQGAGFDDKRHLWPHLQWLIQHCKPPVVLGEQVASRDAEPWLDLVQDDLEALGYAFGAVAFPAAGVGAPQIRDRTYWAGHSGEISTRGHPRAGAGAQGGRELRSERDGAGSPGTTGLLGDAECQSRALGVSVPGVSGGPGGTDARQAPERTGIHAGGVAYDASGRRREERADPGGQPVGDGAQGVASGSFDGGGAVRPIAVNGLWRDADWLLCRDGKWRPVEPGTFPLAHGAPARVGRLRAYGNSLCAPAAEAFIRCVM